MLPSYESVIDMIYLYIKRKEKKIIFLKSLFGSSLVIVFHVLFGWVVVLFFLLVCWRFSYDCETFFFQLFDLDLVEGS